MALFAPHPTIFWHLVLPTFSTNPRFILGFLAVQSQYRIRCFILSLRLVCFIQDVLGKELLSRWLPNASDDAADVILPRQLLDYLQQALCRCGDVNATGEPAVQLAAKRFAVIAAMPVNRLVKKPRRAEGSAA